MITIKDISADDTYKIRSEVLRKEIDLPSQFSGDFDKNTFHLGVFENEKLVGISSFMKTDNSEFEPDQYQLRGMATLSEVRGKGFGKLMLDKAVLILKEKKITVLWCNAREIALQFYVKQDFEIKGKPFEINKIGLHYKLFKNI